MRAISTLLVLNIALLVPCASAAAQSGAPSRFALTRTFRCAFPVNARADMRTDVPQPTVARETFELTFDQIDRRAGTGRMIGNQGGSDVSVVEAPEGITIIEVLGSGYLQVTAIYTAETKDGRFKAVHSRHSAALGGEPVPSQYYGSCAGLL